MRVGVMFSNIGPFGTPQGARAIGEAADANGIESLWTVEHVVVPKDYASAYPYSPDGKMPGGEDSPIPDPLVWLTYVAACTSKVRLATGILILPQRSPVILAKELATIDVLSSGRLTLGVGIGWLREEMDAIGVPFDKRAPRTDEAIEALRALWSTNETYQGEHFRFAEARSFPKPVQQPGVPIVIGGHTTAAAHRAGRLGDGFFPASGDLPALFEECRRAAKEAGRDPDAIELTVMGAPNVEHAKRMADLGVSRICVYPPAFNPTQLHEAFGRLSESFVEKIS